MCAQFSAFMGIPFSWILLTGIEPSVNNWNAFAVTLFFMGLCISWCASCANNPMFAEVVPPKHRTMIYAFDRAFEGSFASFAAPAVGFLTEKIYGYDPKSLKSAAGSAQGALALSRGLFVMMVIPFGLCCLFYSPLYVTFKRDRDSAKAACLKEQEMSWKWFNRKLLTRLISDRQLGPVASGLFENRSLLSCEASQILFSQSLQTSVLNSLFHMLFVAKLQSCAVE